MFIAHLAQVREPDIGRAVTHILQEINVIHEETILIMILQGKHSPVRKSTPSLKLQHVHIFRKHPRL